MSERFFRFVLGASLLMFLYIGIEELVFAYIAVLLFEGLTNWRIPILASRLRYGKDYFIQENPSITIRSVTFDAERTLRILVALMLIFTFVMFREQTWFFPWFVGFMLFMAGVTNICPMVMGLRWLGFR